MSTLFILGNTNQHTFANSIVAAQAKNETFGHGLSYICAIHSTESDTELARSPEWKRHIQSQGIDPSLIAPITVDLQRGDSAYRVLAKHLERILLGQDHRETIYVDLTNGLSLYKSTLSVVAYILGLENQFVLDVAQIPRGTHFLSKSDLLPLYLQAPNPRILDSLAPLWLTEIRRYRTLISHQAAQLLQIDSDGALEVRDFQLESSAALKYLFDGERALTPVELAHATHAAGKAFEVFIRFLSKALKLPNNQRGNLVDHIASVAAFLRSNSKESSKLFLQIATVLRHARNKAAHPGILPFPFQRIEARMSFELLNLLVEQASASFASGQFGIPSNREHQPIPLPQSYQVVSEPRGNYYFGLDGDNTGRELESMFSTSRPDADFTNFSERIKKTVKEVARMSCKAPVSGSVLFCAGDDLLFKGSYSREVLEKMKTAYHTMSGGHTCSIGFGRTLRETYVALKLAKATPGKDSIVGIQFVENGVQT